jgi:peptidyl-prolyl cis-trans isomerase SurA
VSDADIAKYKQQNLMMFEKNNRYHLLDFTILVNDPSNAAQIKLANQQAQALISKLKHNANVDAVGVSYDDLGWRNFAELPDIFIKPLEGLAVNGISNPIQAPNGFHVLKILDIKSPDSAFTKTQLKHMVWEQKANIQLAKTITKLRKTAYIKILNQ